jgi:integrase
MIDTLLGAEPIGQTGLQLAGIWGEYDRLVRTSGKRIAPVTLAQRRQRIKNFVEWAAKHRSAVETAEQVDRAAAAAYADYLAGKGSKAKTRANILNDLGAVWGGLQRIRDGVTANPWRLVVPEVNDSERGKAFSRAQEKAVIKAADKAGSGWGLMCRIARYTGLRYGDVAGLTWARVDLERRVIELEPSKTARHGISVKVPIAPPLFDALAKARRADPKGAVLFSEVFDTFEHYNKVTFATVLQAAKITGEGYTFHSWRHTFRTRLAEAGVSRETAMRLGGWTEEATADRYDHDGHLEEMRAAVEKGAG